MGDKEKEKYRGGIYQKRNCGKWLTSYSTFLLFSHLFINSKHLLYYISHTSGLSQAGRFYVIVDTKKGGQCLIYPLVRT